MTSYISLIIKVIGILKKSSFINSFSIYLNPQKKCSIVKLFHNIYIFIILFEQTTKNKNKKTISVKIIERFFFK